MVGHHGFCPLSNLQPGVRQDLLRVLTSPERVRADVIRQFFERPEGRSLAQTLMDLEADELLRLQVVAKLRELESGG